MAYWHGCNYPWSAGHGTVYYGLDFGANVWGSHVGVSTRRASVAADFDLMARLGFTVVRWFVFCDGRGGIAFDDWGLPSGLDPHVFADVDAALEIARDTGIGLNLVLLDHHWMFADRRERIADPVSGALLEARLPAGRASVLRSDEAREALFATIIEPLVARYGHAGARRDLARQVFAFELMNEPDFVIEEWERDRSRRVAQPLPFEAIAAGVARLSAVVHASSSALTTIGCARLHNLWAWDDAALGLDVLQLHSYPDERRPRQDADVFGTPAASLGMKRRVILGEFPGNGAVRHPPGVSPPNRSLDDYLEFAVEGGYAGAWPWSFSGTDAYGPLPGDPLRRFAARHPQLVNPRAARAED